jgi:hypothetical protein
MLDRFARSVVEAHLGRDVAAGVRVALWHYCTRRGAQGDRLKWERPEFPCFLSDDGVGSSGDELELTLDPGIEATLQREALANNGISPERLVVHAVFVYLADLDRVAQSAPRPLAQL